MVVSWTPLFVLFDVGVTAGPDKTILKIANLPFPAAANGENPCLKLWPNRIVFPAFTRSSSRKGAR
jgi:hypothetical protein